MSKDDYKSNEYKVSFKPNLKIASILKLKRENPDLMYLQLRVDKAFDPYGEGLDNKLNAGWQVVYENCGVEDDRTSSKSKEQDDSKSSPIVENGKGNAQFIYLYKPKADFIKDEKERIKMDKAKMLSSSSGRKIEQKGQDLKITDPEVNMKNFNND
jgi:hypothetical protein